jgi:hypothetical protein
LKRNQRKSCTLTNLFTKDKKQFLKKSNSQIQKVTTKEEKPHGFGKLTKPDGTIYDGNSPLKTEK